MSGSVLHKNRNPPLPNFRIIALCYFSYLKINMVYCKLQINEIHNLKQFQKISVGWIQVRNGVWTLAKMNNHLVLKLLSQKINWICTTMRRRFTHFPQFLHLPSINKTCSVGDINLMNLLVPCFSFQETNHLVQCMWVWLNTNTVMAMIHVGKSLWSTISRMEIKRWITFN